MSIGDFISSLAEGILEHYGDAFKGLSVAESGEYYLLIVLEGVDSISFLMRGEIFNHFYNKVKRSPEGVELVRKLGGNPPVIGVILSPRELEHGYPFVISVLSTGVIAYDPEGILSASRRDWRVKTFQGKKIIDLVEIKKGQVVEL